MCLTEKYFLLKGLVEKWLKEVQTIMLDSVLVQMKGAYDSFWASKRIEWLLKWCGQIIQTVSRTTWTKEVTMSISPLFPI